MSDTFDTIHHDLLQDISGGLDMIRARQAGKVGAQAGDKSDLVTG